MLFTLGRKCANWLQAHIRCSGSSPSLTSWSRRSQRQLPPGVMATSDQRSHRHAACRFLVTSSDPFAV
ncbi:hypothetical protein EYF80_030512 [Liparis tanakae]|uniref:Uncharacterized protein n=1 Tax=Liparis tanakae TaxID=230148 RepID=A0A4Z2H026_9TELE|nr:hypothetical protein EYF80_030512 [Liparis tanakae]